MTAHDRDDQDGGPVAPVRVTKAAVKPLASPATEYGLIGSLELVAGSALGVATVVDGERARAVADVLFAAAIFAACMYVLALRSVRRAVKQPPATPAAPRERPGETRRRVVATTAAELLVIIGLALLTDALWLAAGIVLGSGLVFLATSRWLRAWEALHDRTVLREPRRRWGRDGTDGRGRGRGWMDPQDFHVLARSEPPA